MEDRDGILVTMDGSVADGLSRRDRIYAQTDGDTITGFVRDYTTLLEFPANTLTAGAEYELSFIFHPTGRNSVNTSLVVEHFMPDGSDGVWEKLKPIRGMPMQFADRTIARIRVRIDHPEKVYKFFLKGPDVNQDGFAVEHILFRPLGVDAWRSGDWNNEWLVFYNNIPLIPSEARAAAPSGN